MAVFFSIVIPVFNRPEEIRELLSTFVLQSYKDPYEILIIEDGSTLPAKEVVEEFKDKIPVKYIFKENSGPGDSRNFGMARAEGNYYILLDSDCLLPTNYLTEVANSLEISYVDCFGGPDGAHPSFSNVQKAINYAMTSWLTTGGIRGHKRAVDQFQPRSFNMGLSKKAFEVSGGFGNIHPGEDPDLSLRLKEKGFNTRLIASAMVYHKRRIDFKKFFSQVKKFGKVRPILNLWHPGSSKITYWFPSIFCLGFIVSLVCLFLYRPLASILIIGYLLYFLLIFLDALRKDKSFLVALLAILAVIIQFWGYGMGFLKSIILTTFSNKQPQKLFPELFFESK